MFQFPGFALKTLCIQVISTCLCSLLIAELTITNSQVGCPIQKSMDQSIFSAPPWLIAEYHVFHRLLLPRHSPNALFALDLIQKKPDLRQRCQAGSSRHLFLWSKVILFPLKHTYMFEHLNDLTIVRVSVLDLDNMFVSIRILKGDRGKGQFQKLSTDRSLLHKTETCPLLRGSNNVVIVSLFTMSICALSLAAKLRHRPIGRLNTQQCLTVKSCQPTPCGNWWSLAGSNR